MQIRVANRQDEKNIQSIFTEFFLRNGEKLDLNTTHKDLRNIEANYFGNEGVFLVAEESGNLIAIAGAKRESENTLSVDRFYIEDTYKRDGIDLQLMQIIVQFARLMLFEKIHWNVMNVSPNFSGITDSGINIHQQNVQVTPSCFNKALLVKMRFKKDATNHYWLNIEPIKEPIFIGASSE